MQINSIKFNSIYIITSNQINSVQSNQIQFKFKFNHTKSIHPPKKIPSFPNVSTSSKNRASALWRPNSSPAPTPHEASPPLTALTLGKAWCTSMSWWMESLDFLWRPTKQQSQSHTTKITLPETNMENHGKSTILMVFTRILMGLSWASC